MKKGGKPEETKPQEQKFAAVIEGMIDVVGISDTDGRIIQINTAVKDWGYEKEELIRKPVVEVLAKRSLPKFMEERKKTLETGVVRDLELIGLRKNGSEFPVLVNVTLMRNAEGKPIGRIFSLRDITQLKRAQEKEKELAATVAAEKAKREAVEESRAVLEERAKKLTDSRTAMIHMLKSLDETGKELAAARDYTDNIIKSMIDTLIVVDPDGNIKTVNKATSALLGYEEEELIGHPVATIFAEEEEEEEVSIFKGTRLKKLIEEGTIRDYDMKYRTKKGEVIPVSFSGSVMREARSTTDIDTEHRGKETRTHADKEADQRGKIIGIVGIARDMREIKRLMEKEKELAAAAAAAAETEKKRAEELERVYKELKEMDKLKSDFIDMASHELRAPLTPVKTYVDMIKDGELGKITRKQKEKLEVTSEQLNRTIALVKDMFDLTRIEARSVELMEGELSISEIGKEAVAEVREALEEKGLKLETDIPKDLPLIKGDKMLIGKTLTNLLTNAIRYAPEDGGRITICAADEGRDIHLKVSDMGIGIPEEDIKKIFDKFYQVKRGTTREPGGLGIGLAIAKSIVELHNGRIWAESELGKGSTFHILLPVARAHGKPRI